MQVKVRFFTSLREIIGKKEESLTFNEGEKVTISTVLSVLSDKYGKPFIEYVFENEAKKPKGFLQFLINGNSATTLEGMKTELKDGDVLAVLPPVGGG
jgi:molybdopterin synthase sulfur carrier subunit